MPDETNTSYTMHFHVAIDLWKQIRDFALTAMTRDELDDAIGRFTLLHEAFASWKVTDLQARHQQSFLTLITDSILWVEARRDNGDVAAAEHDMAEAGDGVYTELLRLYDDAIRRQAADEAK